MEQYPTEEEEYELQYGDELDAMDDMGFEMTEATSVPSREQEKNSEPPRASTSFSQYSRGQLDSPHLSQVNDDSPLRSPAFSQISKSSTINKRLFGTPGPSNYGRIASTPFPVTATLATDPLNEIQNLGLNPRKRRLDALFGDIRDIEEEGSELDFCLQGFTKKTKTEEEKDLELIEKILEARKRFQAVVNPIKSNGLDRAEALHRFKMQNLSYSLPKWPFATVVRSDKERIYVRFHSEEYELKEINEINCFKDGYNGLLGDSKERIWNEAKEIISKRFEAPVRSIEPDPDVQVVVPDQGSDLWVEKYRPKRYVDLLSDESTNRSLLQWLKLWDKVVFGREPKQKHDTKQLNSFNKKTGRFESNGGWKRKNRSALNTDLDEHGRPSQKLALLCGPPGLGKTTLAHTIARHAGYVVREVNASDDRSPEAFRLALESGTQMKSVLNEDKRPNCIVLDEIDGAPLATIDFLLRFVSGAVPQKGGSKKGKSDKSDKFILKRPIICICNDMYVPALRQLRQMAFVVNFPPTESARLAERLLLIAKQEKIQTDLTSMLALADKTGNDVRSCLSMLQFHGSLKKPLRLTDVLKSNVGQKDRHKGLFGIWSAIFQIQRPRKTLVEDTNSEAEGIVSLTDMSPATRMVNILDAIHMGHDYDRLMQGVFENYLHQKMPDPNMVGVAEAGDWFCFNDRIQQQINHLQNYSIYSYLAYGFVVWHYLFAGLAWPKINFPTKGFETSQKLATCKLILTGLRKGLSAHLKGIGEGPTVLLDTVPLLKRVINPALRSVSLQLLTPKEKSDLTHTVEVMADFGLNYIQLKSADGTYQYQMNPDIDLLGQFQGTSAQNLSYFGKQIVAREVELEQMRRAQPKAATVRAPSAKLTEIGKGSGDSRNKTKQSMKKTETSSSELPNHLQTLKPKPVIQKVKQVVCKDFFGRITTRETSVSVQEGGTDTIVKSPIWYRYKEGYNNAVRKDVTLQDLM
ncbi:chromosome transmission fidelity protein 18 homolog [Malaya genurostris]|uniref:chromosome transmission fidelity protein 18 homolog n=1 Tax=Malaya genurostris TaxID=325434 RepID=UPI0026F3C434|nr:chromosome transmission fidelity protein 18 homolog [Malaya genurostris]XP_058446412.1 chromosome transmission fidelity protein 18 homolog [Malaya genurostris]